MRSWAKLLIVLILWSVVGLDIARSAVLANGSQNFGQLAVGATPLSRTVTYSAASTGNPTIVLAFGAEFAVSSSSCMGTGTLTCTVSINFQPRLAGLRQDALLTKDSAGKLASTILLYGVGLAPQAVLLPGTMKTVAGIGSWGYSGDGNLATSATLRNPQGLAIDSAGNLYVADSINQVIRQINAKTGRISTVVGNGGAGYSGDGGVALNATLNSPAAVAVDGAGNLYIADQGNNAIRKVNAATLQITTLAGGGAGSSGWDGLGDGGPAANALLNGPNDVALDGAGNLYIADSYNGLIRKVASDTGIISVVAGGGNSAGTDGLGNGSLATNTHLNDPVGIALDSAGNLYVADMGTNTVRRIDAVSGISTTVAGNGGHLYNAATGPAINLSLAGPAAVRVDSTGNIYIVDKGANVLRMVNARSGSISTIAGSGAHRYSGDGGLATSASLADPMGLAIDTSGNIYIADYTNNVVRELVLTAVPSMCFDSTLIGQASSTSSFSVMNTGNATLSITKVSLPSGFTQMPSGSTDCSVSSTVAPGAACTIAVAFTPATSGSASGTLGIATSSASAAGASQSIALAGTGIMGQVPAMTLSSSTVTFGNQPLGTASASKAITLTNSGTAPLQVNAITLTGTNGPEFSVSTTCGSVIAAGGSCSINTIFKTDVASTRTASITVFGNVANSPQVISLTGVGASLPQGVLNLSSMTFDNTAVGAAGSSKSVTLTNPGGSALSISGIGLSSGNSTEFSLTTTCGTSLPAGASCSLSILFRPKAFGLRKSSLLISTNAAAASLAVTIKGMGTAVAQPTVWRPVNGVWYVLPKLLSSPTTTQWGLPGDIPVPGDYDGDGVIDFAVYRPSSQLWFILPSTTHVFYAAQWGLSGDMPVPADYDGDGRTDLAIYRPSTQSWYIVPSATGAFYVRQWGLPGDLPVPGDYDGDGKADVAVFRPSNSSWYILPSGTGVWYSVPWGMAGDIPVAADYDGDGKIDVAIYRPSQGMWWIIPSRSRVAYWVQWGLPGDKPVPGDYDGDGKADPGVWRPANGTWYLATSGALSYTQLLGTTGDILVDRSYWGQ